MARVARKIGGQRWLALIGRYLRAGVLIGESIQATELRTPQGGLCRRCSPTFCWMTWTRNWKGVAIGSSAMRTTC